MGGGRGAGPPRMPNVRYAITATLHERDSGKLCRATRAEDGCPVLLKLVDPQRCAAKALQRLRQDYEIGTALDLPTTVRPLALETYQGMVTLVLEDFGGEPLGRLLGAPMPVEKFLRLAVRVASALAEIHGRGVVHNELQPSNILVEPSGIEARITGFGRATRSRRELQTAQPPQHIEGSLPYLSPEQTGRMNRAVDSRSDLYSLGIVFYEMVTGRLPFEATDPLEWVHCHVARAPASPTRLVPEVPDVVARIVVKLLSKMAEDRYQSARGLAHDLQRCLEQWTSNGTVIPFPLGELDISDRLQIPQKLYGRKWELETLLHSVRRVSRGGQSELFLVSGQSGAGKSSLVRELYQLLATERGTFLSGKFDERRQAVPYSPIVHAFRELIAGILAAGDREVAVWRQRLQDALGENGQLVVDLIPQLELVIGTQPRVVELEAVQATARFGRTFQKFIASLTGRDRPLVLFIDDLQWADVASLTLLRQIATSPEIRHLLVIGSYREDEVRPGHPLARTLDEVRRAGARVRELSLSLLSLPELVTLVMEALRSNRERAGPLAALLHEKTGGNPFFVIQFLTSLHAEGLVEFDRAASAWRWDVARIAAKSFTSNVVDLMVSRIGRLTAEGREALEFAACLGGTFAAAPLAAASRRPVHETERALDEAVREGLLRQVPDGYAFLHDAIQQAAYARISESERPRTHLCIGRILLEHTSGELPERVFELLGQLNRGIPALQDHAEREQIARLDLLAARRARASAAFRSAADYCAAGLEALEPNAWTSQRELAFELCLEGAECEFGSRSLEEAERRLDHAQEHARTRGEQSACQRVRIDLYTARGESLRALEAAIGCLRLYGLEIPVHPSLAEVEAAERAVQVRIGERPLESIADLPSAQDGDVEGASAVLAGMLPSAYFVDLHLHRLLACSMVDLTLEHGLCSMSPMGLAAYGLELCLVGRRAEADRCGQIALKMVERAAFSACRSKVHNVVAGVIYVWNRDLRSAVEVMRNGVRAGLESGDLIFSCLCHYHVPLLRGAAGDPLGEVEAEAQRSVEYIRSAGYGPLADVPLAYRHFVRALQKGDTVFSGPEFDEAAFANCLAAHPLPFLSAHFHLYKLEAQVVAGDTAAALASAAVARPLVVLLRGQHAEVSYTFFAALALAAAWTEADDAARSAGMQELSECAERLRRWAADCPGNFLHRSVLVDAEVARVHGRPEEAMQLYQRAIREARRHGSTEVEALAHERAAACCLTQGHEASAEAYLREARAAYLRWGAPGKARRLESQFPAISDQGLPLDALAIAKAAQAISSEIVLARLLEKLLRTVMEQAGADRGALLLSRPTGLVVGATAAVEGESITVRVHEPFGHLSSESLPESVLDYVRRTREPLVVSDAVKHELFSSDPHVTRRQPRAMLCLPILRQAELQGLLYLENSLAAGAFTSNRLPALTLLASQAAISMQSAMLLEQERVAREAAEGAERRSAFLSEAGVLLAESLDYEATLGRLSRLCVKLFADWCIIDVADGREVRRLAGAHADPSREPLLEEVLRRYPLHWDSPHLSARVLRSGEALLVSEVGEGDVRGMCEDEEHTRLVVDLGFRSGLAVPLLARGQALAVLTLGSGTPGRYGAAELEFARELARRAAIAIDNARLFRDAQRATAMLSRANDSLRAEMAERKQAEEARAKLENQLLQAQRMQSVGLLAGGIAHDFNNLLTVILSGAEALKHDLREGSPPEPDVVEEIAGAGRRARDLTRQLLAFARRQIIAPVPLDLNALVRGIEKLLRRVLGEDIDLLLNLQPTLWTVRCDPAQIEQVVLNLAVNSRDAMPSGGKLTIETTNFDVDETHGALFPGAGDGPYVRFTMRDSGVGMPPEVKARVFEPFYTTKPVGKGTGLGLATVYGIVNQSGGFIRFDSEPGHGTTFELLFPRISDAAATTAGAVSAATPRGTETTLVVEDEP